MDQIIEILKISIPPLIVFAITYYMLKAFLDREKRMRAEELKYLRGDSTKLRTTFGWKPEYTFETLMDEMIEHWLKIYER